MRQLVDPSGRGPKVPTLFLRGVATLSVAAVVVALLLMQSNGAFSDNVAFRAVLADVGDGLHPGADVKSRGVLIGTVGGVRTETTESGYRHVVELKIKPDYTGGIPASAKARVVPSNLFGAPSIQLVADDNDTTPIRPGALIPPDTSREGLMMQTTFTTLRELLTAVQPGKLNSALSNIAQALSGRGDRIGNMISVLDDYVSALNPHADEFGASLTSLADALESLDRHAPELLDTVDSFLTTSRTVVAKQQQLAATLAAGTSTSTTLHRTLRRNTDRLITVLHNGAGITDTVADVSRHIPRSFIALGDALASLRTAAHGDSRRLRVDLVLSLSPFAPYTAADCPRYPGLAGPNCGDPVPQPDAPLPTHRPAPRTQPTPAPPPGLPLPTVDLPNLGLDDLLPGLTGGLLSAPTGGGSAPAAVLGGTVGPVGSPQEAGNLRAVLAGTGIESNAATTLLLAPVLRGSTVTR